MGAPGAYANPEDIDSRTQRSHRKFSYLLDEWVLLGYTASSLIKEKDFGSKLLEFSISVCMICVKDISHQHAHQLLWDTDT